MEPGLKRVPLWIKSVASLRATRVQQLQPVSQPLQPLAQVRMMNTPDRLFSLGINSTGMEILCQRDKARYRKDTKSRHQTKKPSFRMVFFAPNNRYPPDDRAGERHLPDACTSPTAHQRSHLLVS
ncbi:MAG: hypothetical protein ABS69_10060 [Nitrosomonadales bacterium SCN 54-20]|nr:MAG: hypothetical protein ABS69_10060 [Nitrosomonadales bacterium SCN 54-20]